MARKYLEPQMAPQYQPPPAKKINAHPSNAIYAPGTGSGTGTAAKKIGWQNRDGSRSPVSGFGTPTGPLTQPMPRMKTNTADAMLAKRADNFKRAVADGSAAQKIYDFNKANPHLYMDAGGNTMPKNDSSGFDVPTNGNGGYLDKRQAPSSDADPAKPANISGQAQSMRDSMNPPPGQDRYGRTSASPSAGGRPVAQSSPPPPISSSARGEWQQGTPGTRFMSDKYGAGSSTPHSAPLGKDVAGPTMPKPTLPSGVGAASTRSPSAPTGPEMAGKQPTPAYTPKPSAVPADRLQKYSDAAAQIKENATKAAAEKASAPAANPMMSGKLPSSTPAASAASTPSVKPLMPGAGFTGPAGESAARMAKQNDTAEAADARNSANATMQTLDKYSNSGFKPSPPSATPSTDTAAKNAARGFDDTADLARYKAEDATTPKGDVQIADEEEDPNLKEEKDT